MMKEKYISEAALKDEPKKKLSLKIKEGSITPEHFNKKEVDAYLLDVVGTGMLPEDKAKLDALPTAEQLTERYYDKADVDNKILSSSEIKILEVEGRFRQNTDPEYPGFSNLYFYEFKDTFTPENLAQYIQTYKFIYLHVTDPDLGDYLCHYNPTMGIFFGGLAFISEDSYLGTYRTRIFVVTYNADHFEIKEYLTEGSIDENYVNKYGTWDGTKATERIERSVELDADYKDKNTTPVTAVENCASLKVNRNGVTVTTKPVEGKILPFTWNGKKVLVEGDVYTKAEVDAMFAALRSEFFES